MSAYIISMIFVLPLNHCLHFLITSALKWSGESWMKPQRCFGEKSWSPTIKQNKSWKLELFNCKSIYFLQRVASLHPSLVSAFKDNRIDNERAKVQRARTIKERGVDDRINDPHCKQWGNGRKTTLFVDIAVISRMWHWIRFNHSRWATNNLEDITRRHTLKSIYCSNSRFSIHSLRNTVSITNNNGNRRKSEIRNSIENRCGNKGNRLRNVFISFASEREGNWCIPDHAPTAWLCSGKLAWNRSFIPRQRRHSLKREYRENEVILYLSIVLMDRTILILAALQNMEFIVVVPCWLNVENLEGIESFENQLAITLDSSESKFFNLLFRWKSHQFPSTVFFTPDICHRKSPPHYPGTHTLLSSHTNLK